MNKFYVLFKYLIIHGPLTRDEAVDIANDIQASAMKKRLLKWGIDPENCSDKQRMDVAKSLGICDNAFRVLSEDEVFEEFPDSFEYYITSKIMR